MEKVVFLYPYPLNEAPSQRFRFVQYLELVGNRYDVVLFPFLSEKAWKVYHEEGKFFLKTFFIINGYFKRFLTLFSIVTAKFVFIHREVTPIGPPIFEFIIAKILRKKIIYDFDDAIWLENYNENNKIFQKLKWYSKVNKIIKWSYKISVGNDYLVNYAKQFNPNVIVNPTTIDTENYHNPKLVQFSKFDKITIGWTGTVTTNKYLDFLVPIIEKLSLKHDFYFNVISNINPELNLENFVFTKWKKETEIHDLLKFDIGVMPLTDDIWAKGKCGFKALQYMSLGVPAIVSPVGVNTKIVDHGINGFVALTEQDWYDCLDEFLSNRVNVNMGLEAREKVELCYSVNSNKENFLQLFS